MEAGKSNERRSLNINREHNKPPTEGKKETLRIGGDSINDTPSTFSQKVNLVARHRFLREK